MRINQLLTNTNYNDSNRKSIDYIVIHYVGATGGAYDNCKYFEWSYRGASAHYFVGHKGEIWQCVLDEDISWHCGTSGAYYHSKCRNSNSIGIEMCCRQDSNGSWYFEQATVDATIELVKMKMAEYNIPASNVIRHYDVTHKSCPRPYVLNVSKWNEFKARLTDDSTPTVAPTQPTGDSKYNVGDYVSTTTLATNSNGGKVYSGKWSGTITRVIPGKKYPYLLNNGTGWTNDEGIDGKQEVKPEPKPEVSNDAPKYKVGDTVKINSIYTSSTSTTKLTPARNSGTITSILQGARNPYLLDYVMGWVNDNVIVSNSSTTSKPTIKKGSKVKVIKPYDEKGRKLYVSGTYDVIEVSGNRVVIGKGTAVTAAIHKDNLQLV
jgi:N-acetylmuramoyl-L-alanine amidase CwlA